MQALYKYSNSLYFVKTISIKQRFLTKQFQLLMTKKIHTILRHGFALTAVLLMLAGCYPKGPEYYSDLDLTVTDYNQDYYEKFGQQQKYWIADTVEYITNIEDSELDPVDVNELLNQFKINLNNAGYTKVDVDKPDEADFVITISVIASEYKGVGWVPGYPCYPGWGWGCGWGGYYPPYWGGYYAYSYTTGSVIANWYDPDEPTVPIEGEDVPQIQWVSTFNGLVSSSASNNKERIAFSVDQAFKQSPYIKAN